ncbi:inactive phospholipase C-like protein 1, partial [Pollicipes pollicipes]|uniref:inactive phospholipase C-like protein 1 n=1 Tax=Pollicipes pollicipes TaxID=41117 RepID=UPI0018858FD0
MSEAEAADAGRVNGVGRHFSMGGEVAQDERPAQKPLRKTKSVSFHSATCLRSERKVSSVQECLQRMVAGSTLIKIRPNLRQYHRFFSVTEDLAAVRWVPSKKSNKAQVPIDSIKEIRTGKNTPIFRNKEFSGAYCEECAFSIIYGEDYESLDLVATSPDEANIWITGLNALIAPDGMDGKAAVRERWLGEMFARAAGDTLGLLDERAAIELMRRLNSQITTGRIKQKLAEYDNQRADGDARGMLTSREFIDMFKEIATRPDIYFLLLRHSNKEYMTVEDLHLFLEGEQGMTGLTWEKCMDIIKHYEPNPESRRNGQLMIDGFTRYLLSAECDVFSSRHRKVCQEMTHPLTHYFISCSHNTYLMQDQLRGPSSVEGYIRALNNGCRCVKVDCWDGRDEEPLVYHGNTLTSRTPLQDVLRTVSDYAFEVSDYPLVLHLENHCSVPAQRRIVQLLRDLLGKRLYVHPTSCRKQVTELSPQELKHRVLIKGKKLPAGTEGDGEVSDEDEGGSHRADSRKIQLCQELSDLISLHRTRLNEAVIMKERGAWNEMFSLSEYTASKLMQAAPEDLIQQNKTSLTRVYPNTSRVDSSNYNPQDFWNVGCQLVALNFQTPGTMMDVYDGRFRQNGCCGYVLKPAVMREPIGFFSPFTKDPVPGVTPQMLRLKVISAQQLPKPRGSTAKATVIDPYVVLQVFGIPADCAEFRGRTVSNEGNSPIFDETFEFLINLPEMALLRFVVLDDEFIGDDFIGQYSIPFECLQTGYRHVNLLSNTGEPLDNATLFVHVAVSSCVAGTRRKSRSEKINMEIKSIGLKDVDEFFKVNLVSLVGQAMKWRSDVADAMSRLQSECGLGDTANIKQCVRVIIQRLANAADVTALALKEEDGLPMLVVSGAGLSAHLSRSLSTLEAALCEFRSMASSCDGLVRQLNAQFAVVTEMYEGLGDRCLAAGLKGKKRDRAHENFAWNARVIQGQMDLLEACRRDCRQRLQQMQSSQDMIAKYIPKDRSPAARERPRLT